jgi:glycosyltransferase involved in cell wall biosynthesis
MRPLVSVCIPLYRSGRFLEVIRENLGYLTQPDIEILLSDRHGLDDALDRLEAEFGADPRVRFLRASDGVGWVDHYNDLLRQARGRYHWWLPHDDTFPPEYLPTLLADLRAHPDAWGSFGRLRARYVQTGQESTLTLPPHYDYTEADWHAGRALTWAAFWNPGIAFRGLFDADKLRAHQLFIRHTPGPDAHADVYWLFGVALHGKLRYCPAASCLKRYYDASTHHRWKRRDSFIFSRPARQVMKAYLDASVLTPGEKARRWWQLRVLAFAKRLLHRLPAPALRSLKRLTRAPRFVSERRPA